MPALSLLAAAFLVLLACLGWVALRVFAARNDKGELTAPGCLNGCAFAVVLAGLGAVGLGTLVVGAFVAATPPEVRETFRDVRHELSGAFTDMREELRGAADELNDELREAAEELRRELPGERNDARPRGPEWTRRRESESSAPLAACPLSSITRSSSRCVSRSSLIWLSALAVRPQRTWVRGEVSDVIFGPAGAPKVSMAFRTSSGFESAGW